MLCIENLPTARLDTLKSTVSFEEQVQMTVILEMEKMIHNQNVLVTIFIFFLLILLIDSSIYGLLHTLATATELPNRCYFLYKLSVAVFTQAVLVKSSIQPSFVIPHFVAAVLLIMHNSYFYFYI